MDERVLPGAYVIFNKKSCKVLHVKSAEVELDESTGKVISHYRDENQHRNQQIWWVEQLPFQEDNDEYFITNIFFGQALKIPLWYERDRHGGHLAVSSNNGEENKKWKFQKCPEEPEDDGFHDAESRIYYNIISVSDGTILDPTHTEEPDSIFTKPPTTWGPKPTNVDQGWQFIKPIVAVPAGWVQIQNLSTHHILSHNYTTYPPLVINGPPPHAPQYRESWGTQWSFNMTKSHDYMEGLPEGTIVWVIKNRLTGASLCDLGDKSPVTARILISGLGLIREICFWWDLEYDAGMNWVIKNAGTRYLLEETKEAQGKGYQAGGYHRLHRGETRRNWVFIHPTGVSERVLEDTGSVFSSQYTDGMRTPVTTTTEFD